MDLPVKSQIEKAPLGKKDKQAGGCSKEASLTLSSDCLVQLPEKHRSGQGQRPALQLNQPHNCEFPGEPCPPPGPLSWSLQWLVKSRKGKGQ